MTCLRREPSLALYHDKVGFQPQPSFLPRVVLAFHIKQDIVLLSIFPRPQLPGNEALHTLNVVQAIILYLGLTAAIREVRLSVLLEGSIQLPSPLSLDGFVNSCLKLMA